MYSEMARASVRGYQQHNFKTFAGGLKIYVKGVAKPTLVSLLRSKADALVSPLDTNSYNIPIYLGHLHDATGCAVYVDGRLEYFRPTSKMASGKLGKSGFDGVNHYGIDGSLFLQRIVSDGVQHFSNGIYFVIYSNTPYAYHINTEGSPLNRGRGYFNNITNTTVNAILSGLRAVKQSKT